MAKRGVKSISGTISPIIGQPETYTVTDWYSGTTEAMKANIKWELFRKRDNGNYTSTNIIKNGNPVVFTFGERAKNIDFKVVGFLFEPELTGPSAINVRPTQQGPANITSINILDYQGQEFKETPKYGQIVTISISTVNMVGEDLTLSLWERDTISNEGHNEEENTKLWETKTTIENRNGNINIQKRLTLDMAENANKGSVFEGTVHEYYVVVEAERLNNVEHSKNQLNVSGDTSEYTVNHILQDVIKAQGLGTDPAPENESSPNTVGEENTREETTPGYWNIFVSSKEDRVNNTFGVAVLVDDKGLEIFKFKVRLQGTGSINVEGNEAKRTTTKGDTPLGAYGLGDAAGRDFSYTGKVSTYGPHPRMVMFEGSQYSSGEITETTRSLIRIHGGRQTSDYGHSHQLRMTLGCIRAFDTDMEILNDKIKELMDTNDKNLYPGHVVVSNDLTTAIFEHTAIVQDSDGATNMRENTNANSTILATVNNGTKVKILNYEDGSTHYADNPNWTGRFKVRLEDGKEGYIYNTMLTDFSHKVMSYSFDSSKTVTIEKPKPDR